MQQCKLLNVISRQFALFLDNLHTHHGNSVTT